MYTSNEKITDSLKTRPQEVHRLPCNKSAYEPGLNSDKRNFAKTYGQMPSAANQYQKLDEETQKKQESVDANWKNDIVISGAFRGTCAETHQGCSQNNGGGRTLDGIDWDSVQEKLSSDVSGAETSWLGPLTTKALHARLLCGIRFFDKNDRLIGNVPACAVKQVCKILTILDKRGELVEELSQVEKDFARNGLEKLRSARPHASCFSCTQFLCPVNPKHPLK